jgi:HicB_like antitoxin of bacterial toxin-antitoxin system
VTVAETLEDLRAAAEEVLVFHIEGMMEDGEDIPSASTLDSVVARDDYKDAVAVLVVKAPDTYLLPSAST